MRIAILEDDPDQLSHLVRTMEQLFTVGETTVACTAFTDGAALQQVLRRESFDLLVLDWNVPGLEGLELLKWLRTWQRDLVPVLMLSSRTSEQDVVQALNFGADDYIVKPFRPLELRARVQRLMARRSPVAQSDRERFGRWEFDRLTQNVLIHPVPPDSAPPERHALTDREFKQFQSLVHREIGIWLPDSKKALSCATVESLGAYSRPTDCRVGIPNVVA